MASKPARSAGLDTDKAKYDIFKVPLQYELPAAEGEPQLLRATFSHATAEQDLTVFGGERIDGEWTADSASVGATAFTGKTAMPWASRISTSSAIPRA